MKLLPISIIALIILTSVVKKPECNCLVQRTLYLKGKFINRDVSDMNIQTYSNSGNTYFYGKKLAYDSVVIVPINQEPLQIIPKFIQP